MYTKVSFGTNPSKSQLILYTNIYYLNCYFNRTTSKTHKYCKH